MKPVNFPEANLTLKAPPGHEETVDDLRVFRGPSPEPGIPLVISCWELDDDDLAEIRRTGRVYLSVQGKTHPPLAVMAFRPFEDVDAPDAQG